jgi:hypothetical protein
VAGGRWPVRFGLCRLSARPARIAAGATELGGSVLNFYDKLISIDTINPVRSGLFSRLFSVFSRLFSHAIAAKSPVGIASTELASLLHATEVAARGTQPGSGRSGEWSDQGQPRRADGPEPRSSRRRRDRHDRVGIVQKEEGKHGARGSGTPDDVGQQDWKDKQRNEKTIVNIEILCICRDWPSGGSRPPTWGYRGASGAGMRSGKRSGMRSLKRSLKRRPVS